MTDKLRENSQILKEIIDIEQQMFMEVQTLEPSQCQKRLKTFRAMREMSFSVWSKPTLESYLEDLKQALKKGRNLLTEKYGRMDSLIEVINDNPLIKIIACFERDWMLDLHEKYPHAITMQGNFMNYTQSELETYSDKTLKLYYEDLKKAKLEGSNLVEKRYINMYKLFGYKSLREVEERLLEKDGG